MFTIAETEIFTATWPKYWTPEEFGDFCAWLALNPEAGDVIPRSGGCRKVRWAVEGRGKRGGVRIIYFYHDDTMPLYLLLIYAKAERENWTQDEKRRAQALTETIKQTYRRHWDHDQVW